MGDFLEDERCISMDESVSTDEFIAREKRYQKQRNIYHQKVNEVHSDS